MRKHITEIIESKDKGDLCHLMYGCIRDENAKMKALLAFQNSEQELSPDDIENLRQIFTRIRKKAEDFGFSPITEVCTMASNIIDNSSRGGRLATTQQELLFSITSFFEEYSRFICTRLENMHIPDNLKEKITENFHHLQMRLSPVQNHQELNMDTPEQRLSVLVADDEILIRELLKDMLISLGHHVTMASNGREACDKIDRDIYDLVFTDIKMPGADGIEVLRYVKKNSPDTEVVIVTGFATIENATDAVRYGAYDYLTKPFDPNISIRALLKRVSQSLALKRENRKLMFELSLRNMELRGYIESLEQALKRLEEKQKALIHADRMASLGMLAAGVAHEINNPNTFIRGNLQTLGKFWDIISPVLKKAATEKDVDEKLGFVIDESVPLLNDMLAGTERIRKIVSGLLSFAHPETSGNRKSEEPHKCIEDALVLVDSNLRGTVDVEMNLCKNPPKIPLVKQQITQVLVNLLMNAVQAMEESAVRKLQITSEDRGEVFCISISDTGCGIKKEEHSKIFTPFFTTKPVGKGTGLGLSIILGIVREHGGNITFESDENSGSTFTICLPARETAPSRGPVRILVVEHDDNLRKSILEVLSQDNENDISCAVSGFQAVYKIGELKPEILVLDIRVPDMGLREVIESIRTNPKTKDMHIICLAGFMGESLRDRLTTLGVNTILKNPLNLSELSRSVSEATESLLSHPEKLKRESHLLDPLA